MSSPMSSTFSPSEIFFRQEANNIDMLSFYEEKEPINQLSMNPSCFMQNYFMHLNPEVRHGSSLMTEILPFHHQTPPAQYYYQAPPVQQFNQGLEDPVVWLHPEQQQPAVQPQQRVEEEVLIVRPERPLSGFGKARLHWTQELHTRFSRAVSELGGCFRAKPKAILKRMNVDGLTQEHIKSHLQKVRTIEAKIIKSEGIQNSLDNRSVQLSREGTSTAPMNGKALESVVVNNEAYGKLL